MAQYKFDGEKLKRGGTTVATVRGTRICKGTGATAACNIRGDKICDRTGATAKFNVRKDKICKGTGASKIADMRDVDKAIDGPGSTVKAALWLYFVR